MLAWLTISDFYTNNLLVDDSFLNSCFAGDFIVVQKCLKCQTPTLDQNPFLTLNLKVFTTDSVNMIKLLRKEHGSDPVLTTQSGQPAKKKSSGITGIFKALSSLHS